MCDVIPQHEWDVHMFRLFVGNPLNTGSFFMRPSQVTASQQNPLQALQTFGKDIQCWQIKQFEDHVCPKIMGCVCPFWGSPFWMPSEGTLKQTNYLGSLVLRQTR